MKTTCWVNRVQFLFCSIIFLMTKSKCLKVYNQTTVSIQAHYLFPRMTEKFLTNLKDVAVDTCKFTGQMVIHAQSLVVETLKVTGNTVINSVKGQFSNMEPSNVEQLSREIVITWITVEPLSAVFLYFCHPLWPEIFKNLAVSLTLYALQNGQQRFLKFDP